MRCTVHKVALVTFISCRLGEGNRWHKFTNFELAARVPLIIRAPGIPNSIGKKSKGFAELVDLYL